MPFPLEMGRPPRRFLLVALAGAVSGCAGARPIPPSSATDPGARIFNGYERARSQGEPVRCFRCHGAQGEGSVRGPALTDVVPRMRNWEIAMQIREGSGNMPAFKDELDPAEVRAIIRWMRAGFPAGSGEGNPSVAAAR